VIGGPFSDLPQRQPSLIAIRSSSSGSMLRCLVTGGLVLALFLFGSAGLYGVDWFDDCR
jgi:hypothetical protein